MNSENKIYIHADDYGYTKSMSSKILDCVNDGKVNSISIMIDGNSEALTKIKGIKKYRDKTAFKPDFYKFCWKSNA